MKIQQLLSNRNPWIKKKENATPSSNIQAFTAGIKQKYVHHLF